jgi:gliding motility-associated-like protein
LFSLALPPENALVLNTFFHLKISIFVIHTHMKALLRTLFFLSIIAIGHIPALSQALTANAGGYIYACPNQSVTLGATPTAAGGKMPYTYSWTPATGLSSTVSSNPTVTITSAIWYTLKVTDSAGTTATAQVFINFLPSYFAHAGAPAAFCLGGYAQLGANNPSASGLTYSWTPSAGLSTTTGPSPVANPIVTTTYTMTATSSPCAPQVEYVTVTVHQFPPVHAGSWTVINEGDKATLHGSGAATYFWSPANSINYNGTPNPDAQPTVTTLYTVTAKDIYGCVNQDTVTVFVNKDDDVVIYNTFSPNGDGDNDFWYIGNITKYPTCKLDIYNRYGKLVYTKIGYVNDWDGTNFGDRLPEATYYYVLDLGTGAKALRGSVSIIR